MSRVIALLRGINVGGNRKVPMAMLTEACRKAGYHDVLHYIQSGNLALTAPGTAADVEAALEKIIAKQFGFDVPVITRSAAQWKKYAAGSPFPSAEKTTPNLLMLCLSKSKPLAGAVEALRERATFGEKIEARGDALWVSYADAGAVAKSKLSTAFFDKVVGSTVTARNFNTVLKLQAMADAE